MNCQRQDEICDYSIRLNWEGRGQKKGNGTASPGQINFSVGIISAGPSRPGTGDSSTISNPGQMQFQAAPFRSQPQALHGDTQAILRSDNSVASELHHRSLLDLPQTTPIPRPSDMSVIDPALMRSMGSPTIYQDSFYGGRPEQQYAQSYERYRSLTPTTPISVQPSAISRVRAQGLEDSIPSPGNSGVRSPSASTLSTRSLVSHNLDSPTSTPPFYVNGRDDAPAPEFDGSDRPAKRLRYHSGLEVNSPSYDPTMPPPNVTSNSIADQQGNSANTAHPPSSVGTPLTPASSHSDDGYKLYTPKISPHESPDLRRLSVSSLLSGPPGMSYQSDRTYGVKSTSEVRDWSLELRDVYQDTTTWGIDRGIKDLDIGKNDDMNAISGSSPVAMTAHADLVIDEDGDFMPVEFGFGMETNNTAFENGGYYDTPVAICIPRALEPLPTKLLENPMNLLVSNAHNEIDLG